MDSATPPSPRRQRGIAIALLLAAGMLAYGMFGPLPAGNQEMVRIPLFLMAVPTLIICAGTLVVRGRRQPWSKAMQVLAALLAVNLAAVAWAAFMPVDTEQWEWTKLGVLVLGIPLAGILSLSLVVLAVVQRRATPPTADSGRSN